MDEASHLDDDDDSIADRWRRVGIDVDDSERDLVRDLLVPLIVFAMLVRLMDDDDTITH